MILFNGKYVQMNSVLYMMSDKTSIMVREQECKIVTMKQEKRRCYRRNVFLCNLLFCLRRSELFGSCRTHVFKGREVKQTSYLPLTHTYTISVNIVINMCKD
jgi:hypothetical protein